MWRNTTIPGPVRVCATIVLACLLAATGFATVQKPELLRPLLAVIITFGLGCVAVRRPSLAVALTFAFLALLALARRLLIPMTGWTSFDPLLLVGPVVAAFMGQRLFLAQRRRLAPDGLSRLVMLLLVVALLESVNPTSGGGLFAGMVGLLFLGAPLVWFFIGQELGDRKTVLLLAAYVIVLGVGIGAYGLWQTWVGFPSWDNAWLNLGGYSALDVGGVTRAFGTFSSSSEYSMYLTIGLILCLAVTLHMRIFALAALPVLALALFMDSVRGGIVLFVMAAIALLALRSRKIPAGIVLAILSVATLISAARFAGPSLQAMAAGSADPLIVHQINGLLAPLDPAHSTLPGHAALVIDGIRTGLSHPLGLGTAATNIGGEKLGASFNSTEVDVSDAFVSLGVTGGSLLALIIIVSFAKVFSAYARRGDMAMLAIAGVLIVTLGQWLNGGQYAVAPLVWFLVGAANGQHRRQALVERASARPAEAPGLTPAALQAPVGEFA